MIASGQGPQETYTISQFIAMKDSDQITYNNYSILQQSLTEPSVYYSIENVIYDYMDELKSYRKLLTLSDLDKKTYQFKPKLLAHNIYGSTEMYFIILALNGMCSIKEFNLIDDTIWAIYPSDLKNLLNTIYRAEASRLQLNRSTVGLSES